MITFANYNNMITYHNLWTRIEMNGDTETWQFFSCIIIYEPRKIFGRCFFNGFPSTRYIYTTFSSIIIFDCQATEGSNKTGLEKGGETTSSYTTRTGL